MIADQYGNSRTAFAQSLSDAGKKDIGTTAVSGWCDHGIVPGGKHLALIANCADVSVDWLLGFEVPRRRTDRELIGDLARELVRELVNRYDGRATRARRDGLSHHVGGTIEREIEPEGLALSPIAVGEQLVDGRVVLGDGVFGLQLLAVDPQEFLARMYKIVDSREFLETLCEIVIRRANAWELDHEESEVSAVRDAVRTTFAQLSSSRDPDILERLLRAALNPLDSRAQAALHSAQRDVARASQKREVESRNLAAFDAELRELVSDIPVRRLRQGE